jgi:parallel beta-helix repeat protein
MRKVLIILFTFISIGVYSQPTYSWRFENNTTATNGGINLTAVNSPAFNTSYKKEGTHSANVNNADGNHYASASALSFGTGSLAISLWAMNPNTSGARTLFDNYVGGKGIKLIVNQSTGVLTLSTCDGTTTGTAISSAGAFTNDPGYSNIWNHIVVRFMDVDVGVATIWVNGVNVIAGNDSSVQAGWNANQVMNFGASSTGAVTFYGYEDNIQIYTCYMSATNIDYLYDNGVTYTEATCPSEGGGGSTTFALTARWPMNTGWSDVIGTNDLITYNGPTIKTSSPDPIEGAGYGNFNNNESNYAVSEDSIDLSTGPVTIAFNIYNKGTCYYWSTVMSGMIVGNKGFQVTMDCQNTRMYLRQYTNSTTYGQIATDVGSIPVNTWKHVVIRWYNINAQYATIWLDGVKLTTDSILLAGTGVKSLFGLSAGNYVAFGGYLDDVRVYKTAASDFRIDSLYDYKSGVGPVTPSGNNWYVDYTGGDDGGGHKGHSASDAFKTIAKINAYAALDSINPGDSILLKRGEVWRESLSVNNVDGTAESKIVFGAYGTGNKPELRGYKILGAFTGPATGINTITDSDLPPYYRNYRVMGSPYQTYVSTYNWLLIDGEKYGISRKPDAGYYSTTGWSTASPPTYLDDNVHPQGSINGGQINFTDEPWYIHRAQFTYSNPRFSFTSGTYTSEADPIVNGNVSYGWYPKYFLSNHSGFINLFGEWAYNSSTKTLQVGSADGLGDHVVEFPNRDSVAYWTNCEFWVMENIKFVGGYQSTLKVISCQNILIDSCEFQYTPIWGIFGLFTKDIIINKCLFDDAVGICIDFTQCDNETIQDCRAINIGTNDAMLPDKSDGGSTFYHSAWHEGTINFMRNYIDSVGYSGVITSARSSWGSTPGDEYVYGNLIMNTGLLLTDGGAFYNFDADEVLGLSRIISNNIIISADGNPGLTYNNTSGSRGIYLDGASQDWKIINNYVTDCHEGIYLNGTWDNTMRYNTLYNNRRQVGLRSVGMYGAEYGHYGGTTRCRYTMNDVILRDSTLEHGFLWVDDAAPFNTRSNIIDSNYYYNPFNEDGSCLATVQDWLPPVRRTIAWFRTNLAWELHGQFNYSGYTYQDKLGAVSRNDFVTVLKNWSGVSHWFRLGDCVFYNLLGAIVQDSALVGAYDVYVLFYYSGTIESIDPDLWVGGGGESIIKTYMTPFLGTAGKRAMKLFLWKTRGRVNKQEIKIYKR